MATKIIPELNEIEDPAVSNYLIVDDGAETFKLTIENLALALFTVQRKVIDVVYDGVETGAKTVDVSSYVADAREVIWMLKKPAGGSTFGEQVALVIQTPDADTVTLDSGDFALDAGTYTLLGV